MYCDHASILGTFSQKWDMGSEVLILFSIRKDIECPRKALARHLVGDYSERRNEPFVVTHQRYQPSYLLIVSMNGCLNWLLVTARVWFSLYRSGSLGAISYRYVLSSLPYVLFVTRLVTIDICVSRLVFDLSAIAWWREGRQFCLY